LKKKQIKKKKSEDRQSALADLLRKAVGIEKGSGVPNRIKVGKITKEQIREIAQTKMVDMVVNSEEAAVATIMGTARSMGIETEGVK
jgi:large subunit ribosomal protein L11